MTRIELDGWVAAIDQLTRIQGAAGKSGGKPEQKRIVSKRRRKPN